MGAHVGLFWRLFIPNAAVLSAASVVLIVAPPNGRVVVTLAWLASMVLALAARIERARGPRVRVRIAADVPALAPTSNWCSTGSPRSR